MLDFIYRFLIYKPLWEVFLAALLLLALWFFLTEYLIQSRTYRLMLNYMAFFVNVAGIVYITLLIRNNGSYRFSIMPFELMKMALSQPTIYRSILMNVFLFVPVGVTLTKIIEIKNAPIYIILFAFFFSMLIEWIQYTFSLGCAEVDDVICNVAGTLCGVIITKLICREK